MAVTTRPTERRDADRIERELLGRLGLGTDANRAEIADAYDRLLEFLDAAPRDLRRWADAEKARADEAYALLSDQAAPAVHGSVPAPATNRSRAARAAQSAATPLAELMPVAGAIPQDEETLPDELLETEGAGMPVPGRRHVRPAAPDRPNQTAGTQRGTPIRRSRRIPLVLRAAIGAGVLAVIGAVAVLGYNAGAPRVPGVNGTPAPEASGAAPSVDPAQVGALMQKITANPKDTTSLLALGNLYFDAADYGTAITFMQKVVDLEPANVDALVGLGAAQFNTGDSTSAKALWTKATQLNPKNQEAWFDLGFLYLNQNPPDMAAVRTNWNQVVAIDATTALAASVKTHLDAFDKASPPADSAQPSGAAATPAGSSPGASPSASGN